MTLPSAIREVVMDAVTFAVTYGIQHDLAVSARAALESAIRQALAAAGEDDRKDAARWRHIDENSTDSIGLRGYAINVWRESPSETLATIVDECISLDAAQGSETS